jgi:CubicO group peptidase (beta-lactamase class C family)
MLWPIPDALGSANEGAFMASGIFGQKVYVNPRENVVIVIWGALPKPTGKATIAESDFFAVAIQALRDQAVSR